MYPAIRILSATAACLLLATASAKADVPLAEAIEIAVQGKWPNEKTQSVTLNRHGFYVRPMTIVKTGDGLTAEGHFRHRHRGKDDRIHFSIVVKKGQPYKAVITKIEYRGLLNGPVVQLAVDATGAAKGGGVGTTVAQAILEALKKLNLQRRFDGKWEPEAAKIVDAIGARLAQDVK